jgi:hypothetical protein
MQKLEKNLGHNLVIIEKKEDYSRWNIWTFWKKESKSYFWSGTY